jgi:hypothetical protein
MVVTMLVSAVVVLLGANNALAFEAARVRSVRRGAMWMVGRKVAQPEKRDGFKKPDISTYMDRYKKPLQKSLPPTFEDEIVGRPMPFEADEDGNWEGVLAELWTSVEEVGNMSIIMLMLMSK